MTEPLATVEEVAQRTGESIEDDIDRQMAEKMIEAASAHVRLWGKPWPNRATAPAIAKVIALEAASRGFMNPAGYVDERSDSVTLKRAEDYAASTELTQSEKASLAKVSGSRGLASVPMTRNETRFVSRSDMVQRLQPWQMAADHAGQKPWPFFGTRWE